MKKFFNLAIAAFLLSAVSGAAFADSELQDFQGNGGWGHHPHPGPGPGPGRPHPGPGPGYPHPHPGPGPGYPQPGPGPGYPPPPPPPPPQDLCVGQWQGQYNNGVGVTMNIWRTGGNNIQMTIMLSNYPQVLNGQGYCYNDRYGHAVINYSGNGMPHSGEINYNQMNAYQQVQGGFALTAYRR